MPLGSSNYFLKEVILSEELSETQVRTYEYILLLLAPAYGRHVLKRCLYIYIGRADKMYIRLFWLLPDDPKNAHLKNFQGAKEKLTLWKADVLDFRSLREAFKACHGVFHTASPLQDTPVSFEFFFSPKDHKLVIFSTCHACIF